MRRCPLPWAISTLRAMFIDELDPWKSTHQVGAVWVTPLFRPGPECLFVPTRALSSPQSSGLWFQASEGA